MIKKIATLLLLAGCLTTCQSSPTPKLRPEIEAAARKERAQQSKAQQEAQAKEQAQRAQQAKAQQEAQAKQAKLEAQDRRKREALVTKLQRAGILGDVEYDGECVAWVKPSFYGLDFKDKQAIASLISAFCWGNPPRDPFGLVTFQDSRTGEEIGSFSTMTGLRLD